MSPTTIVRLITLLVNVSLALFLIPLDAINVVGIRREYLLAQFARASHRIEIDEVNNLAHRLVRVFTVELAQLVIKPVTLETPPLRFFSSIDPSRLHAKLHFTE